MDMADTNKNQVFWGKSRKDLPVQYADIYLNPVKFLEVVTAWMNDRRWGKKKSLKPTRRTRCALTVVRESPVFHGVGLYTVSELFHLAGKPITILLLFVLKFSDQAFHPP